jgi:hypothetical protein
MQRITRSPKQRRHFKRLDALLQPPRLFVTNSVNFVMMRSAHGDGKLVADLASKRSQLRKSQMMRIGRSSAADETRLPSDELEMLFVSDPARLRECEHALIDLCWRMSFD